MRKIATITTIFIILIVTLQNITLADQQVFTVCAEDEFGVPFQNRGVREEVYEVWAEGSWGGAEGDSPFTANGSPNQPSTRSRLVAPLLTGGALILQRSDGICEIVGTNSVFVLYGGHSVRFKFNDYPGAYHDNRGCLKVVISDKIGSALLSQYQLHEKFHVCAGNEQGVLFSAGGGMYVVRVYGTWGGAEGDSPFTANGSPNPLSTPGRLVAPHLPGGALILQKANYVYEGIDISKPFYLAQGEKVIFKMNDYPGAYHDNWGCLAVVIFTKR